MRLHIPSGSSLEKCVRLLGIESNADRLSKPHEIRSWWNGSGASGRVPGALTHTSIRVSTR